jgi:hypothetical protein
MNRFYILILLLSMVLPSLNCMNKTNYRERSYTDSDIYFNQKIFHRARIKNKLIAKANIARKEREKSQLQQQKAATWQSIAVIVKSPKNQPVNTKRVSPSQEACEYSWDNI